MAIFGIFHCAHSSQYTELTIQSFLKYTKLSNEDEFFVLDNDGDFISSDQRISVMKTFGNTFAQNVNIILERALNKKTRAYCLNNDLYFTRGWREPLETLNSAIVSPRHSHSTNLWIGETLLLERFDIKFFNQHLSEFASFADSANSLGKGENFEKVWLPTFSCFCLTPDVISTLGPFDQRFMNGGEDADYALRAHLNLIPCIQQNRSFVFHFRGKSTYNVDNERKVGDHTYHHTLQSVSVRQALMKDLFSRTWGPSLSERMLLKAFIGPKDADCARKIILKELQKDGIDPQTIHHPTWEEYQGTNT